jgi:hypothetical protein
MENPDGHLPASELDEKIHRVIADHHRLILADLEEASEVLLHLGW